MNLEYIEKDPPLRVLMGNALTSASKMMAIKIFNGLLFGLEQFVDLILLVYTDEVLDALSWKRQLESICPPCFNSVKIMTDLPSVSDADVFIFFTNFNNPNIFDVEELQSTEGFDSAYLMLKIASNLKVPKLTNAEEKRLKKEAEEYEKVHNKELRRLKPVFMCDGLVPLDILCSFSTNVSPEHLFCPSPVPGIANSILGDTLKVLVNQFNRVHVFGANDHMFHVEYETPLFKADKENWSTPEYREYSSMRVIACDNLLSHKTLTEMNLDRITYNPSWLKKEFIEKVRTVAASNVHGPLYKVARMTKALRKVVTTRINPSRSPQFRAVGCISDGSLGTIKGLPYVLPLNFYGDRWDVNDHFADSFYLKAEIKTYNEIAQKQHAELMRACRKFLEQHVIKQGFAQSASEDDSDSRYHLSMGLSSSSLRDSSREAQPEVTNAIHDEA